MAEGKPNEKDMHTRSPESFWATSNMDGLISAQKNISEIDKDLRANRQGMGMRS